MAQTSGRVCHFGSDCDAAVNISVEPHQRARLGLIRPPAFFPAHYINSVPLMLSLRLSPLLICCRLQSFRLLWFGGAFTIRLVGSPPF